jgi:peptidoglycan hydrolase CwlO-like protein
MNEPDPSVHMVMVLRMQLNDAHELARKAQRKARYLQGELDKEIARGKRLEADIAALKQRIEHGDQVRPGTCNEKD